jgi:hypothetical protein
VYHVLDSFDRKRSFRPFHLVYGLREIGNFVCGIQRYPVCDHVNRRHFVCCYLGRIWKMVLDTNRLVLGINRSNCPLCLGSTSRRKEKESVFAASILTRLRTN